MSTTAFPPLPASGMSQVSENKMNAVYVRKTNCPKTQLKLSIGDPTFDGNLLTSDAATKAMVQHAHTPQVFGYQRFWGSPAACEAVAKYWANNYAGDQAAECKAENVVLGCGASEALQLTFTALCNEGDNVLIPAPGFGHYAFICDLYKIEKRLYNLNPDKKWEIDLEQVKGMIDDKTRAILITNPSNPCGSNFSRQHVEAILKVADEMKVPVIADEIYSGMVYEGEQFTSVAAIKTPVPRFVVGGTAKNFMAPGWRMGWVMLVDTYGYAASIIEGMHNLSMMSLGPNALTQKALPQILGDTDSEYGKRCMKEIEENAKFFAKELTKIEGLSCQQPQGALYIMVKIDEGAFPEFHDDVAFQQALEDEENVQVVPGSYLFIPGFFRVCITRPKKVIEEVMPRLAAFCDRHRRK